MSKFGKLVLFAAVVLGLGLVNVAWAHETKTIGSLSILLHMEPQDSPVVKEPAHLFFAFTDAKDEFNLKSCACRISILYKDQVIFEKNLESADQAYGSNVATLDVVFPQKGVYQLAVSGESPEGKWDQFSLTYDVRIERESLQELPVNPVAKEGVLKSSYGMYAVYALGIVGFFGIIYIGLRKTKRR